MQSNHVVEPVPLRSPRRTKPGAAWRFFGVWLMMLMMAIAGTAAHAQLPPAGATIGNQASATYTDGTGKDRVATSNTVITIVQQVNAFDLQAPRVKQGAPNATVYFPHTVTNEGNGPDQYTLGAADNGGDFTVGSIVIYADENGDGVPDNFTPLLQTPVIAAGASYSFVVAGLVPGAGANPGDEGKVLVTATSKATVNPPLTASKTNEDTVTVSNNAIVDVTKGIDNNKGTSNPQSTHKYTLTYINNGIGAASALTITDDLNTDLTYAGNAEWSQMTGTLTPSASPQQGNGAASITYTVVGQLVTAVISNVAPGESGTISFDVTVNANITPKVITNTANFVYNNGVVVVPKQPTNEVPLTIDPTVGITGWVTPPTDPGSLTPPTTPYVHPAVPQGSTLYFVNRFQILVPARTHLTLSWICPAAAIQLAQLSSCISQTLLEMDLRRR